ncbi:LPS assembly protein LptD [Hyphococcus flavus]|uniref:LPS-assembly protein LptD n=1 Tax=Hyphococcus flavus TaxID=1866326 RepID=A0AAE9ZEK3_9PROT|nr:LPS assembly protein LptD [Hyphococcus flavus]WDI31672.1 LPS assembly protein LptD [Hyphococcus flavus]
MTTFLAGGCFAGMTAEPVAAASSAEESDDPDRVLFEADVVSRDQEDGPIVAEGDVRAYFGERYLRADKLIYNPSTDIVVAEGNVSITDANLETAFAGRVELSGDLRDGIAENFSALLDNNARLAADTAIREQGARTRLSRAVYTSCNVCNDEGEGKTPTWRIKSLRVTRDEERKVVRFHHAFLEIKGVPILYAPYLQTPDPSVERQSGFLPPNIGASSRLGFNVELPYYLAISNHQDATLYPKISASDGVLWQGEWRRRSERGYHVLQGGVIDFDNTNEPGVPGVRWHLFGRGHRRFGDNWRVSYDVERISDDTYLRQYDVERRGDLRQELDRGQTNQLRSNGRLEWRSGGSQLVADTYAFQGLRAADDSSTTPYVLPLIDFRHNFRGKIAGGRASIGANFASLYRTGGIDTQRFTASANWDRDIITKGGHRFQAFAEARMDAYHLRDLDQGTEICLDAASDCAASFPGFRTSGNTTEFETRLAPTIGVEWSYPLMREFHGARLFIEPKVQLVASIADQNPDNIINEDSQSIEFDYAGLFDYNKATGFDSFEDGQRVNIGVSASALLPNNITIEGAVGQQFRAQTTDAFENSSGLGEKSSDIVGSVNVRIGNTAGVENRFRIDNEDGDIQRAESMAYFRTRRFTANLSYVRLNEENISNNLVRREELTARGALKVAKYWTVGGAWRLDLESDRTIRQDFTVGYEDECSTFGITYRRDRTRDANLEPDNAVLLSFTLKSLVD